MKSKFITFKQFNYIIDAVRRSLNSTKIRDECLLTILFFYGLRASEIGLIKLTDINIEEKCIYINPVKGGVPKRYDWVNAIEEPLDNWLSIHPGGEFLFPSYNDRGIGRIMVFHIVAEYAKKAGIPAEYQHPHSFRHGCAIYILQQGFTPYQVQKWLRHKSIKSTEVYTDYFDPELNDMAKKL